MALASKELETKSEIFVTKKVKVETTRDVHSYAEFWHTASCLEHMTNNVPKGALHLYMGTLVFTAFSLEAFLNHIGKELFTSWSELERLSPKSKMNIIAEKLEIDLNYGGKPWQVFGELFTFRNAIAHGTTHTIDKEETQSLAKYNLNPRANDIEALAGWEKLCTPSTVLRLREDVRCIVFTVMEKANIENDYPFSFGAERKGSTVI